MKPKLGLFAMFLGALLWAQPDVVKAQFTFTTNYDGSLNISHYTEFESVVVIPSTTNGLPVTSIGTEAFQMCTVTSVTVPDSITSIGDRAFFYCGSLANITIGSGVTSIGEDVFVYSGSLTTITVDANNPVYSSVAGVLFNKSQTTLVYYPTGAAGNYTIPNSVTDIGNSAFFDFDNLTNITFGANVTSIGDYAFGNCTGLASVTIPNSVTNIGIYAFGDCGLTNLTIPNSVIGIGGSAFYDCESLTNVTISTNVASIGAGAFAFSELASVTIPNGVTDIGNAAFYYCTNLTSVIISTSVTNLEDYAFYNCSRLKGVYFQGNAPSLGAAVFYNDNVATVYYLPGTSGWSSPFGGRPAVMIAGSLKVTISPAAANTAGAQWQVDGGVAQASGATVSGLAVGNHMVTFTPANGWAMPPGQSVAISSNLTTTASGIYAQLTYVTNNGAITITKCTNGGAYILPSTINGLPVTSIDSGAFQNINTLTNITIPGSITNIWDSAFQNCGMLAGIYFQGNAPSLASVFDVFQGDNNATIYYLPGTSGWSSSFGGRPAVMLNSPNPAGSLKVTLSPVAAITNRMQWQVDGGVAQFSGATVSGLSVGSHTLSFSTANGWAIPAVQSVAVNANATTTTNGTYGQLTYVTNNGAILITKCTNGGAYILPSTISGLPVTTIGSGAFENDNSLTSITIPASITNIWDFAFEDCGNLTGVYFQSNPPILANGFDVFQGDFNATIYYLPGTSGWGSQFGGRSAVMLNPPNPAGSLKVTLSPAAITNLAQWQVDGGIVQVSGAIVLGLSVGSHTVSFSPINGWAMPASQSVAVSANSTNTFSPTYGQLTLLTNNGAIDIIKFKGNGGTVLPNAINGRPVTIIDSQAFQNSSSLTSVMIPNSVTNIGNGAFATYNGLTSLMAITVDPGNSVYSSTNGVLFNKSQTILLQAPSALGGSYSIPPSVTNIWGGAFGSCPNLTSVTIPNSVTMIGGAAFYGCISLTNVTMGTNVAEIEDQAFQACYSLTSITLPSSVTVLGTWTFAFCYGLTGAYFQGNIPSLYFPDYPPFTGDTNATIYYLPSATGWGNSDTPFGDCPGALWLPQVQASAASFGVQTNQFGFNITWANNTVVVVEACTNLANPAWFPVGTNTLIGGSSYFKDTQWAKYPGRFYRLRSP